MNGFKLSGTSLSKLDHVHPLLVGVVREAIRITETDFGVICGIRTEGEQQVLVDKGLSKTLNSKHLIGLSGYGYAVDLMAYHNGRACWEIPVYFDICEAMQTAGKKLLVDPKYGKHKQGASIRWGGSWNVKDITDTIATPHEMHLSYLRYCNDRSKTPFVDAPHFELTLSNPDS